MRTFSESSSPVIKQTSSGFSCDLPVDPKHFNTIIGPKGATVSKMRQLTGCNISVPRPDSNSTTVSIIGPTREAIEESINRIQMLTDKSSIEEAGDENEEFSSSSSSAIQQTSAGFSYNLPVDPKYWSAIIGPKGATVTKMRQATGCNISVPKPDSKATTISIVGPTREAVEESIHSILVIVNGTDTSAANARPRRQEFDFFISIPLLVPEFSQSVEAFYEETKSLAKEGLIVENRAFMKTNSLHFTLCMLHLHSEENQRRASELLDSLKAEICEIAQNKPLDIDWGGVATFSDAKLSSANIVFAEPGPKIVPKLKAIGNLIRNKFGEAGLVNDEKEQSRELALHATLLNTRPQRIDATRLVALKTASFAPLSVDEIHLSQRFKTDANGYYHCAHKINLR